MSDFTSAGRRTGLHAPAVLGEPGQAARREFMRRAAAIGAGLGAGATPFALNLLGLSAASAQAAPGYKALVCLFLFGGNDSANMVLPTDAASWQAYTALRSQAPDPIALRPVGTPRDLSAASGVLDYLGGVLPLTPRHLAFPVNAGRALALHPAMSKVQALFEQGRLAVIANAGPLVEPLANKAAYRSSSTRKPAKLFSHNDQQSTWQALAPEGARVGWGGRLGDMVASSNARAVFTSISAAGNAVFAAGNTVFQYQVGSTGATAIGGLPGVNPTLFGSATAGANLRTLITGERSGLLAKEYNAVTRRSVEAQAQFQAAFTPTDAAVAAPGNYTNPATRQAGANALALQLRTVARIVAAAPTLGVQRQVFFVSLGGFDTHDNQNRTQSDLLARVSHAIAYFDGVLDTLGARNQVTLFTASDFGRTFTSNGDGTDHGWGAHHFVHGGAVRGRDVYGRVPQVGVNHDDEVGSGSFLPGVAVDQIGATLGRWFGVGDSALDMVFPNLRNFQRDLGFMA